MSFSAKSGAVSPEQKTRYRIFIYDDPDTKTHDRNGFGIRVTDNISDRVTFIDTNNNTKVTMSIKDLCNLPRTKSDYTGPVYHVDNTSVVLETEAYQNENTSKRINADIAINASEPIAANREILIHGVFAYERSPLRKRKDTVADSFEYQINESEFSPKFRIRLTLR